MYEFVAHVSLNCMHEDQSIFSKVITLSPRYVLVNHTAGDLRVLQAGCLLPSAILVGSNARVPLHWADIAKDKLIHISYASMDAGVFDFSGAIDLKEDTTCFRVRGKSDHGHFIFLKAQILDYDKFFYVVVTECTEKGAVYLVENKLKNVVLDVYQSCHLSQNQVSTVSGASPYKIHVPAGRSQVFGWDVVSGPDARKMVVELRM